MFCQTVVRSSPEPKSSASWAFTRLELRFLHAADRNRNSNRVKARLLLPGYAQVCASVDGSTGHAVIGVQVAQREGELFLCQLQKSGDPDAIEQVAKASLLAVGAVSMLGKDTHHGRGDSH